MKRLTSDIKCSEKRDSMRVWWVVALIFVFTTAAHAQHVSTSANFFVHDRFYETFLRDHMRFKELKPLRIEYWNINWMDSSEGADEYKDYLYFEGLLPIYTGKKVIVDIPFQYRHLPMWVEDEETSYGGSLNVIKPELITRWTLTDRIKAIVGWEYNMKGDSDTVGGAVGRKICFLKTFFSYDIHPQLNFIAGARLDRYYYDTDEEPDDFELSNRLYYNPAVMLNWHPSNSFILLVGIPGMGAHLEFGNVLKVEARASIDEDAQIAISVRPFEKIIATLRFLNTPYKEIPVEIHEERRIPVETLSDTDRNVLVGVQEEDITLTQMLHYTDKSILFEIGWKLNPAALGALGFRYSPDDDVEFKDVTNKNVIQKLDGKSNFAIGATFTVDLEVLFGMR